MRVLLVNNYDMEVQQAGWQSGQNGSHHLWGLVELEQHGFSTAILPYRRVGWLSDLRPQRWGDGDQELRVLARWNYDILYAAASPPVMGLCFLRALGLFPKPIVCLIHHPLPGGRQPALYVRGMDRIICLSRYVAAQTIDCFPEAASKVQVLQWGWDLSFQPSCPPGGSYILSVGKTLRDYDTLCQALREVPVSAKIIASADSAPKVELPPNVELHTGGYASNIYRESELRPYYEGALAVAVPLANVKMLTGLTSLLEAMACGKPVVVTRNCCLDIDVEGLGCGLWAEPEDAQSWVRALRFLLEHPREAKEMGERGRSICESSYNITRFGQQLASVMNSLR